MSLVGFGVRKVGKVGWQVVGVVRGCFVGVGVIVGKLVWGGAGCGGGGLGGCPEVVQVGLQPV